MDVHRCRFVPYPPAAINALAFSHTTHQLSRGEDQGSLRLAVGRANGDLEIWNPLGGAWFQESIFRGGEDRSIEGLVWTLDPSVNPKDDIEIPGKLRLFSIGYSAEVTEWDLATGTPARHVAGNMGEIWCIAVQPIPTAGHQKPSPTDSLSANHQACPNIAVGCTDGSIILFSTAHDDLQYQKVVSRPVNKKSRVLSIAYQHLHTLIAGYADSTIRVFDTRTNRSIRTLSLGPGIPGGPKETLVWSLTCLADGTFISGDSMGTVKIWDGTHYVLRQSIASHTADVLTLSSSADGKILFSGGMDRRTVIYHRDAHPAKGGVTWRKTSHRRTHRHDVKTITACEAPGLSVIASGGLDTNLIITPLKNFGKEHHRTLSSLPQKSPTCSAPSRRLMAAWWDRSISVWRIAKAGNSHLDELEENDFDTRTEPRKLVARIQIQGSESITHADLSSDGRVLLVCTSASVKAFRLGPIKNNKLRVRVGPLSTELAGTGARLIKVAPNREWLAVVTNESVVKLFQLQRETDHNQRLDSARPVTLRKQSRRVYVTDPKPTTLGSYLSSISQITFSADSRILVAADLSGRIHSWVLHEKQPGGGYSTTGGSVSSDVSSDESDDGDGNLERIETTKSSGQRWARNSASSLLPKLPNAPLVLSFRPLLQQVPVEVRNDNHTHANGRAHGEDRLLILTSANEMFEFNILNGGLSDWSRRNPPSALPPDFQQIRDPAMGCLWDTKPSTQRVWIYGSTWLWMFDLAQELPGSAGKVQNHARGTKRKRSKNDEWAVGKPQHAPQRSGSGAGDRVRSHEIETGLSRSDILKHGADTHPRHPATHDDVDLQVLVDDENENAVDGEDEVDHLQDRAIAPRRRPGRAHWHTLKYRPILGMMSMTPENDHDEMGAEKPTTSALEVALVERPLFDVDLPPRYHGDQEWDEHMA